MSPSPWILASIAPDVWGVDTAARFPGGVAMDLRMTVVRLSDGGLWLHSPVPIDDALAAQLAALGPVRHLVAPSRLHHLHMAAAQRRYPQAATWLAPTLPAKRPDLRHDGLVTDADAPWRSAFDVLAIDGIPWMGEVVFLHRPSATLLVTDLFFHLAQAQNRVSKVVFSLYGILGKPVQSPLVRLATRDTTAAAASARALLAWPFERAVPAHGAVVQSARPGDAHAVVAAALAGMLARGGPAALVSPG